MRSAFRRATIAALIAAFLAPGLIHARPFDRSAGKVNAASEVSRGGVSFSAVWNLLAKLWSGSGGASLAGSLSVLSDTMPPPPPSTATTPPPPDGDNGNHLDPNG